MKDEWEPHAGAIAIFMDGQALGVEEDIRRLEIRRGELLNARMYQRLSLLPDRPRRSVGCAR